jgi:uncharacterized membrane protein (Fun14 family)
VADFQPIDAAGTAFAATPAVQPMPVAPTQPVGMWEMIKAKLHVDEWLQKINFSSDNLFAIGTYVAIGFFTGFLFKKYFKYLIFVVLGTIFAIKGLEYLGVIHVDWLGIQQLCGLKQVGTVDTLFKACVTWVRARLLMTVSLFAGFIIGYMVA